MDEQIIFTKADRINWMNTKLKRTGIILYDCKKIYLGVDYRTNDLTDFGGEIMNIVEDPITGAIREFREETLKCFPSISWLELYRSYIVLTNDIVIFFLRINYDPWKNIDRFSNEIKKQRKPELSKIISIYIQNIGYYKFYSLIDKLIRYGINKLSNKIIKYNKSELY